MLSSIKNYFEDQINGVKFVDLFQQIASTITGEYINDIYISIEESGFPPSFEDIMHKVNTLTTELTMRAEWMRDNYKEGKGYRSIKLTTGCKRIIKQSIDEYLRQVKSIQSIRKMQHSAAARNHSLYSTQLV